MPPNADARRLAKTFEPILLFHPDEQFFPIDPKWYLERCSLWRAVPKFDDKANWGEPPRTLFPRKPQLGRGEIAALATEISSGGTWLGSAGEDFGVTKAPSGEAPPPPEERFLDFAGWEPAKPPPNEVTAASVNRHAALDPGEYAAPLAGSRPWYYVEYLDNQELLAFTRARTPNGLDLFRLVANNARLSAPKVLLYHLFYPLHQEALEGCEEAGEGRFFGTYAGEWACIAILVDSVNSPRFIGVTSRNVGDPIIVDQTEQRLGMTVHPWSEVQSGSQNGANPKIFVSRGTHGNYLTTALHEVTPFMGGVDLSSGSCGVVEGLDDVMAGDVVIQGQPSDLTSPGVYFAKFWLIGIGWAWMVIEANHDKFGTADTLVEPTVPSHDQTGGPKFGKIIRPDGLDFPETAQAISVMDWQMSPFTAPAPDNRAYDFLVDRATQVWWVPRTETPGWSGRWGPRVTNDPHNRRAGMKCPDFLLMFLEGVAVALNK